MTALTHDERTLRSISRPAMMAYLRANEWLHAADWAGTATVYSKVMGEREHKIWVPLRETFSDYADNMERSVNVLALVEQRGADEVLFDLRATDADLIRITGFSNDTSRSLTLNHAQNLLIDARSMIIAAARSAEQPRPAYLGNLSSDVDKVVSSVVPAPMDFRTFDLRLIAPNIHEHRQDRFWSGEPLSRRTVNSLASGLRTVDRAILEHAESAALNHFAQGVDRGVSANLCAALAQLAAHSDEFGDGFSVTVRWSRLHPHNGGKPEQTRFSAHSVDVLEEAAEFLRSQALFPDLLIEAEVVFLQREPKQSGGRIMLLEDLGKSTRRIEAAIEGTDYQLAVDAHKQKRRLRLVGDLQRTGRRYELRNPRNVRLTDNPG